VGRQSVDHVKRLASARKDRLVSPASPFVN
jgi:hypothetical protein